MPRKGKTRPGDISGGWGDSAAWDSADLEPFNPDPGVDDPWSSTDPTLGPVDFNTNIPSGQSVRLLQMKVYRNNDDADRDIMSGADVIILSLDSSETSVGFNRDIYVLRESWDTTGSGYVTTSSQSPTLIRRADRVTTYQEAIVLVEDSSSRLTQLGAGNDTRNGSSSADALYGGSGSDRLSGEGGHDALRGESGNDTLWGKAGDDVLLGEAGRDTLWGGSDEDYLHGGADADLLYGEGGRMDVLDGGSGDDVLHAGDGLDFLFGGAGNDTLYSGAMGLELDPFGEAGQLAPDELFGGEGNDRLIGWQQNDELRGEAGNDSLIGGNGDDYLDGGAGSDRLEGGSGNDTYFVDSAGDVIVDSPGTGIETVKATVSWTLAPGLDHLDLLEGAVNGTGNNLNNTILGNNAANVITGLDGSDYLDGGAGRDRLIGGTGNDTYVVDDSGDVIVDSSGTGIETVIAYVDWTLGPGLDRLELGSYFSSGARWGTGNTINNTIIGNSADNTLRGLDGDDLLNGSSGNDTLLGDAGSDTLVGGSSSWNGRDILNGYGGTTGEYDVLTGETEADTFVLGTYFGASYVGLGYATITDFNWRQGDKIQARGTAADYSLIRSSNWGGTSALDTEIYYRGDLVGIARDTTSVSISLDFIFV